MDPASINLDGFNGTKWIGRSALIDALSVFGSMYGGNSRHACGYLFNVAKGRRKVSRGMFAHSEDLCDGETAFWDGYIDFEGKFLLDLDSGEKVSLVAPWKRSKRRP
jgi:hypothetical protein